MSITATETELAGQVPPAGSGTSPYVGPKSFSKKDASLFFGREAEAVDLKYQVMAEPVTLLYAMSGAGKTSLINARVIPKLEDEGCTVLPAGRVRGSIKGLDPAEIPDIFVHHVLSSWTCSIDPQSAVLPPGTSLLEGLEHLAGVSSAHGDLLIAVIDQFEELFTTYPSRWEDRRDFLIQLSQAVRALPNLRVLLAMREDYLASMDPYVRHFPDRLASRCRLEQLRYGAALAAVTGPLNGTGYAFAPGVAEKLVNNLMKIRTRSAAGSPHKCLSVDVDIDSCQGTASDPKVAELLSGQGEGDDDCHVDAEFIEPVQLQVVCQKLWEGLGPEDRVVNETHLRTLGDVDLALAEFYSKCASAAAAATGIREADVRRWFEEIMITPYRTRGMIIRGSDQTGKLPNAAVEVLDNQHLIRSEDRGGARWYELTHDRFIDPILESNRRWRARRSSKSLDDLERKAKAFDEAPDAKRPQMLLSEDELLRAETLVAGPDAMALGVSESLQRLVQQSRAAVDLNKARLETQRKERDRRILICGIAVLSGLLALVAFAWKESAGEKRKAEAAAQLADASANKSREDQMKAEASAEESRVAKALADAAARQSREDKAKAEAAAKQSREDKAKAEFFLASTKASAVAQRDASEALAQLITALEEAQKNEVAKSVQAEAERTLRSILLNTRYRGTLGGIGCEVTDLDFSANGRRVALVALNGSAQVWDIGNPGTPTDDTLLGTLPPDLRQGETRVDRVNRVMFDDQDRSGTRLIVVTGDPTGPADKRHGSARIWTLGATKEQGKVVELDVGHAPVVEASFSADGRFVALAIARSAAPGSADGRLIVYEMETGQRVGQPVHLVGPANCVGFHRSGNLVVASGDVNGDQRSAKGTIRVYRLKKGQTPVLVSQIKGYDRPASHAVFTPGGDLVAAGCRDGSVRVFRADTGEIVATLLGHTQVVTSLEFSRDGSRLVTCSGDRTARVWDAGRWLSLPGTDWMCVAILSGHTSSLYDARFSPDGSLVLTSSYDRSVRLWDTLSGQAVATISGHRGPVYTARFSQDGALLATASADKTARVWEVRVVDRPRQVLDEHLAAVRDVAFDPRGSQTTTVEGTTFLKCRTATASADGTAILWDVFDRPRNPHFKLSPAGDPPKPHPVRRLEGHSAALTSLSFSPDGQELATASLDGTVRVWGVDHGQCQALSGLGVPALGVTFAHTGRFLLSSWADGTMRLHVRQADGGFAEAKWWYGSAYRLHPEMFSGDDSVLVTPNAGLLHVKGAHGTVEAWDLSNARQPGRLATLGVDKPCSDAAFGRAPDGATLLGAALSAGQQGGAVRLWSLRKGTYQPMGTIRHRVGVERVVFRPDGRELASEAEDGVGRLWPLPLPKAGSDEFRQPVRVLSGLTGPIANLAYLPDGLSLLTDGGGLASDDGDTPIRIWAKEGSRPRTVLSGRRAPILALGFPKADPAQVVTIGRDSDVRRWGLKTGEPVEMRRGPGFVVTAAALSPDCSLAVTGADDGSTRLWETATGRKLAELEGHSDRVMAAAYSPDGSLIVTAAWDSGEQAQSKSRLLIWNGRRAGDARRKPIGSLPPSVDYINSVRFHPQSARPIIVVAKGDLKRARLQPEKSGIQNRAVVFVVRTDGAREEGIQAIDALAPPLVRSSSAADDDAYGANATTVSPDGTRAYVACGGREATSQCVVRVYDINAGKWLDDRTLVGHTESVLDVALSRDGQQVVTASADNTARVWNAEGHPVAELKGHSGDVARAGFSPDGKYVATLSRQDGTVRIWDGLTAERLFQFASRRSTVNSATLGDPSGPRSFTDDSSSFAFNSERDPRAILTAHGDGRARFYKLWLLGGLEDLLESASLQKTPAPTATSQASVAATR